MKRLLILLALLFVFAVSRETIATTGTITVSIENVDAMVQGATNKQTVITVDCTATAGGAVSGSLAALYAATSASNPQITAIVGKIKSIETIPGASGDKTTSLPTPLYDLVLTDSYGLDVSATNLGNRSGTVAEKIVPVSDIPVNSELTLTGANCGSGSKFRIIITLGQ